MVKNLVNDWASVFLGVSPVAGRHVVFLLFKGVLPIFVIGRNLSCTPRREANLDLRGRQMTFGDEQLTMALLLRRDILFGIDVAVRLGVGAGGSIDWSGLVRG
jgi:hypothetical protein